MEVLYKEDDQTYIDFIPEGDWTLWVKDFFIEGGLNFPKKIDTSKTIKDLTDEDYIQFFEELGWKFIGISEYNPVLHTKQAILKNHDPSTDAQA